MKPDYDVIVIGGGMVGAACAAALGQADMTVCVIDAGEPVLHWDDDRYDLRVSAISRASQNLFENLGAWNGMVSRHVQPYSEMEVWDAKGTGRIHFDCAELGEANLGHIIENRVIVAGLVERLQQLESVSYLSRRRPVAFRAETETARLTLDDQTQLTAQLVIGADGARSWLRGQLGIQTLNRDYGQKGVVATVHVEDGHRDTAWQRFLATGPLALLPIARDHFSIVWSTSSAEADRLVALDTAAFDEELNQALGQSPLGTLSLRGPAAAFPLRRQHAPRYVDRRAALIGDAAHTIHPLAGQGVNLGLLDAAQLAEVLLQGRDQGRDLGSHSLLRRYERARKGDNLLMMGAMEGFHFLFGQDSAPVVLARNLGLSLSHRATPLKNHFMRHAMGLSRELPALSRQHWD